VIGRLSNMQKRLDFLRKRSVTVAVPTRAVWLQSRILPRRLLASAGLRWWRPPCAVATDEKDPKMPNTRTTKKTNSGSTTKGPTKKPGERKNVADRASGAGSKQAAIIAQLSEPAGATIDAIMKATGWQPHSVRGFLAGIVRKKLNLKLNSEKVDGTRVYRIAGADGGKADHRQSKRLAA
jgi:hypothetical protein